LALNDAALSAPIAVAALFSRSDRLQPDPGAATDDHDCLPEQLGLAAGPRGDRFSAHRLSFGQVAMGGPAPTGLRAATISPRSAFSPAT